MLDESDLCLLLPGDAVINLREDVLHHRINLAMAAMDEDSRDNHLSKALAGLERYFFLVAFASYVAETDVQSGLQYSEWLQVRMTHLDQGVKDGK